ncbi:MAG: hypothetical protein QM809_04470 [Gordonia sp. (in: high G+C Gram-positive bacteria)]|uniref:hypothetical protein n=1 Tax=Gordonia sp. (in: high G+C Gram-positive bacteria) TaxID=84139 RepID=UPI0039E64121
MRISRSFWEPGVIDARSTVASPETSRGASAAVSVTAPGAPSGASETCRTVPFGKRSCPWSGTAPITVSSVIDGRISSDGELCTMRSGLPLSVFACRRTGESWCEVVNVIATGPRARRADEFPSRTNVAILHAPYLPTSGQPRKASPSMR